MKTTGYKHQTLPVHLYWCFLAMADKFQTSNTVNFKFPFWPLLYSLHKSVILFALGYWGKKASLKCHCDQSNRTPPQAQCSLRVYICKRWHLECKSKNWVGLLCPVMWPLSFSIWFISLPQTSVSRRALALKEGRAGWAGVPAHLSRQCWLPGDCRGQAQKHAATWHHRLLTKLAPTIALLTAPRGLGCRAQVFLLVTNIHLSKGKWQWRWAIKTPLSSLLPQRPEQKLI